MGAAVLFVLRAGSTAREAARRRNNVNLILQSQSPCLESFASCTVHIEQDRRRCPRLCCPGLLELQEVIAG